MSKVKVIFTCPCKNTFWVDFKKPTLITPTITKARCEKCDSVWMIRFAKVNGQASVTTQFKQIEFTDKGLRRSNSRFTETIDKIKEFFT